MSVSQRKPTIKQTFETLDIINRIIADKLSMKVDEHRAFASARDGKPVAIYKERISETPKLHGDMIVCECKTYQYEPMAGEVDRMYHQIIVKQEEVNDYSSK